MQTPEDKPPPPKDHRTFLRLNSSPSPDGTRVAFGSAKTGNGDIYIMNLDGSDLKQITSSDDLECAPSWSPDGSQIIYMREHGNSADTYVYSFATGASELFAENTWYPIFVSYGKRVLCGDTSSGQMRLAEIDVADKERTFLGATDLAANMPSVDSGERVMAFCDLDFQVCLGDRRASQYVVLGTGDSPCVSPNGRYVVFLGEYSVSIKLYDTLTKTTHTILHTHSRKDRPTFFSDSKRIIYLDGDTAGLGEFHIVNVDGSGDKVIGRNY
ncbi:MAG: hypothetical protein U0R49_11665 [Fimbriimonadales bacterium]